MTEADNSSAENSSAYFNETERQIKILSSPTMLLYYIAFILACLILILGLFGTCSTLAFIWRSSLRSRAHSVFIFALGAADILSLITVSISHPSVPKVLGKDITAYNDIVCKLFLGLLRSSLLYSSAVTVLICIERFICIWFYIKARRLLSKKVMMLLVCASGIFAVLARMIPSVFDGKVENGSCKNGYDVDVDEDSVYSKVSAFIYGFLFTILPLIVLMTLTPLTVIKLRRHQANRERLTISQPNTASVRITIMLTMVVVRYICLIGIPTLIIIALIQIGEDVLSSNASWARVLRMISAFTLQFHYAFNCVLYGACQSEIREKLVNCICCCRKEKLRHNGNEIAQGTHSYNNIMSESAQLGTENTRAGD